MHACRCSKIQSRDAGWTRLALTSGGGTNRPREKEPEKPEHGKCVVRTASCSNRLGYCVVLWQGCAGGGRGAGRCAVPRRFFAEVESNQAWRTVFGIHTVQKRRVIGYPHAPSRRRCQQCFFCWAVGSAHMSFEVEWIPIKIPHSTSFLLQARVDKLSWIEQWANMFACIHLLTNSWDPIESNIDDTEKDWIKVSVSYCGIWEYLKRFRNIEQYDTCIHTVKQNHEWYVAALLSDSNATKVSVSVLKLFWGTNARNNEGGDASVRFVKKTWQHFVTIC